MAVLLLLVLGLFVGPACSMSQNPRIIGGSPTTIQEFPSVVQIEILAHKSRFWFHSCGGTILNSLYALTAPQCVFNSVQDSYYLRIRAGATYRNTGGVVIGLQYTLVHPDAGRPYYADIALARFNYNLQFSSYIQPAVIIVHGFNISDNSSVIYAGWGATSEGGPLSDVLKQVTVPTINRDICRHIYGSISYRNITDNVICTGELGVGGKDTCTGDYGGPLFYRDIVVGVATSVIGSGCARPYFPGIATSVAPYTPWIVDNAV